MVNFNQADRMAYKGIGKSCITLRSLSTTFYRMRENMSIVFAQFQFSRFAALNFLDKKQNMVLKPKKTIKRFLSKKEVTRNNLPPLFYCFWHLGFMVPGIPRCRTDKIPALRGTVARSGTKLSRDRQKRVRSNQILIHSMQFEGAYFER